MSWNPSRIVDVSAVLGIEGQGLLLDIDGGLMADDLAPFAVEPEQPIHDFGEGSVRLRFNDEAQAKATSLGVEWTENTD